MDGSEAHRQRQWRPPQLVNYKAGHNPLLCSPSLNKARQKYNIFVKKQPNPVKFVVPSFVPKGQYFRNPR